MSKVAGNLTPPIDKRAANSPVRVDPSEPNHDCIPPRSDIPQFIAKSADGYADLLHTKRTNLLRNF